MSKNQITTTIKIQALIDEAQRELQTFGKSLKDTWKQGEPPKRLSKEFESLKQHLVSLQEIAKKGTVDISDISRAESDYRALKKGIHDLTVEFKLLTTEQKKALIDPQEQAAIKARTEAIKKYTEAIEKNEEVLRKRKGLESKKEELASTKEELTTKKSNLTTRKTELKEGPKLSKAAQGYKENSDRAKKLGEQIDKAQDNIQNLKLKGKKEDGVDISRIREELAKLKQELNEIDLESGKLDFEETWARYKNEVKEVEGSLKNTEAELKNTDSELEKVNRSLSNLQTINPDTEFQNLKDTLKELGVEGADSAKDIDELRAMLQQLESDALKKVEKSLKKEISSLDKLGKAADSTKKELDDATESIKAQNEAVAQQEAFETRIKQFLGVAGAAQVLRAAVRDAMATIKELDATMTEMAVVTDLTVGDYWDQLPEYSQRASDLGVSINSAYKAATLYYQQGLKTNEVNAISAETLKMAKIAGLDAADATNKMTAALRGFNMELNEESAQRVSDVYSELAAITAADTKEIANAMTKTASIASSAGMEFETTAAFLSQIIETTRESAETAGTAMKTVIARFQELKKAPSEIGEVDGEIVDANAIETALRSVGVALRDSSGQFRDLDDVFLELSSKWDSLDKNTQRYIATIAAGSRQQSRFIAMMSDYSRTQELVTAANNSAGASNKQFEKTMDSLEAKMEKLRNAWHEFTMGIMNSDLVKFGVDVLTKFLEVVNKATNGLNGLGGSITKILTILTVFKLGKTVFEKLRAPMVQFFADIVREAGIAGEKAGRAAREGLERSKQGKPGEKQKPKKPFGIGEENLPEGYIRDDKGKLHNAQGQYAVDYTDKEKKIKKAGVFALGWDGVADVSRERREIQGKMSKLGTREDLINNATQLKDDQKIKKEEIVATKAALEKAKLAVPDAQKKLQEIEQSGKYKRPKASKEWKEANAPVKAVEDLNKQLEQQEKEYANIEDKQKKVNEQLGEYDNLSEDLGDNSQKQWEAVGAAVQKTGAAITGVGVAASTLGGIFSSLGLDWLGEAFTKTGNAITMVGGAVSALGAIIPAVTSVLSACGISLQASFWPILVIGLAIVALIGTIALLIAAFEEIKSHTPEAKMQAAAEAADAAAEMAEKAAEAYDNLNNSLEELQDGYKALDNLRKGTEEWKNAVNDLNNSVLDLITQYPELASLVQQDGGVLRLDVDSKEVQDVLQQYRNQKLTAAGAMMGSKAKLSRATWENTYSDNEAIKKVSNQRMLTRTLDFTTEDGSFDMGKVANMGMGAAAASEAVNIMGPWALAFLPEMMVGGALLGGALTEKQQTFTDTKLQDAIKSLGVEVQSTGPMSGDEMQQYLEAQGVATLEARTLAKEFSNDTEALQELIRTTEQAEAQEKAYYSAMATQAQAMLDLAKYTQEELAQMTTIVDDAALKKYTKMMDEKYADDDSKETEADLKEYVESLEGVSRVEKIKNNKIVYYDEEGKKQKVDKEIYMEQMKAAKATEKAAQAMEKVPTALQKASAQLDGEKGTALSKAFSAEEGKNLVASDLSQIADENELKEAFAAMGTAGTDIWGDFDTFKKDYQESFSKATMAFEDAVGIMNNIGFEGDAGSLFGSMTAEVASAWAKNLNVFAAQGNDVQGLQGELNAMLAGLSEEQIASVMGQVNAIDMTDMSAWEGLKKTFDELNIPIATDALQDFIDKGIQVSNAIEKINFDTFNQDLHDTYELIQKIKSGGGSRSFDESSYKQIIENNANLADQFRQVGDEFIYVSTSMDALVEALEENTIANIDEANRQLDAKIGFSKIAEGMELKDVNNMDQDQLRGYLNSVIQQSAANGLDVADLGVKGLSNSTNIYDENISKDQLLEWAEAFAATGGQGAYYQQLKNKNMREADILGYTYNNTASENAAMASQSSDHAEALLIQAIQSSAISEGAIEKYRAALESGETNTPEFEELAKSIADSTEKIIVSNENRDAMNDLVNRVTDALYDQGQKEIDKLSEIKDATDTANSNLISKIQEQIDGQRQARQNAETEKNISNMRSRATYLGMSSGGNALAQKELDKQIKEAEQDYQDTLVDQAIQDLQDANEKATEQRERQIELAQMQLDSQKENGQLALEAASIVEESLRQVQNGSTLNETTMYGLLLESETEGLNELEKEKWTSDLVQNTADAADYLLSKEKEEKRKETEIKVPQVSTPVGDKDNMALLDALGPMDTKLEQFRKKLVEFFTVEIPNWWNTYIAPFFTEAFWQEKWGQITVWWDTNVAPVFTGEFWSEKFTQAGQAVGLFVLSIIEKITAFGAKVAEVVDSVKNWFYQVGVDIEEWWNNNLAKYFTKEYWIEKWNAIVAGATDAWNAFVSFFTETIPTWWNEKIMPIFTKEYWKEKWNAIKQGFLMAWGGLKTFFTETVVNWFKENILPMFTLEYWQKLGEQIGEGIKQGFEDTINTIIRGLNGAFQGLVDSYNNTVGSFGEGFWSIVNPEKEDKGKITFTPIPDVQFKTGGLADFTGPAWLDGTKSRPEYVLNSAQTERFFSLVDVLEGFDTDKASGGTSGGDNHFEIEINVDKLENDYDVEQLADKIRRMLYDDASYRNVKAVGLMR